jgi:replicative DNA helicase
VQLIKHFDLPMSMDLEIRTIGALLAIGEPNNHKSQQAMLLLEDDYFYNSNTRSIYQIIRKQFDSKQQFDVVTISALIESDRYEFFQHTLREEYFTANMLKHDIEQLGQYRTLRKQLLILSSALDSASTETIPSIALTIIADSLNSLTTTVHTNRDNTKESIIEMIEEWFDQPEDNNFIYLDSSPFPPVPNQCLITIAGRSGHGKTFIAMHLMDLLIDQLPQRQHLFFNLEMHKRVMLQRYATLLGHSGDSERALVKNALTDLIKKNLYFINLPMITIEQIEMTARISALTQKVGVIVVDYLGLIKAKARAERNDLQQSDIAKRLAALGIELDCIVIGLIQVNRDFKNRPVGQRVPRPEDSAESMGSVHSATWWLGIDQPQKEDPAPEYKDLFQMICRKNRHGEPFYIDFDFKNGMFFKREKRFSEYTPKISSHYPYKNDF